MKMPTIHLNGTSANALLDAHTTASEVLLHAIRELEMCAPNARDYPEGTGALYTAQKEHEARVKALQQVRVELNEIAEHVADHL